MKDTQDSDLVRLPFCRHVFSDSSDVRIENANTHLEPLPEAIDVIQQYGALVDR